MDLKNMIPGGAGEEQAPEQRLSKEEYAAMKKQQREEVWAEVDVQAQAVFQNGESLKGFLDFMAQCNTQKTPNLLLIYGQNPQATVVKSYDYWKKEHRSPKAGVHGYTYMVSTEYEKDGERRTGYIISKGFDISQMLQPEEEARGLALSSELFINGSLNTFAQKTNVDTKNRIIAYDIRELGEQLMPLGMLVTLDSIFNRVIQNWKKGKTTWIFADEFYLLFRYQYSADFFYRLYKRIRKYQGFVTGLTQNVEELLKSDTARLMLANSEFLILLNQATTDRDELASLLNISENQLSYITNVGAGKGLIRCSGNLVPFENSFPKNTKLYRLMTTKPGEC